MRSLLSNIHLQDASLLLPKWQRRTWRLNVAYTNHDRYEQTRISLWVSSFTQSHRQMSIMIGSLCNIQISDAIGEWPAA